MCATKYDQRAMTSGLRSNILNHDLRSIRWCADTLGRAAAVGSSGKGQHGGGPDGDGGTESYATVGGLRAPERVTEAQSTCGLSLSNRSSAVCAEIGRGGGEPSTRRVSPRSNAPHGYVRLNPPTTSFSLRRESFDLKRRKDRGPLISSPELPGRLSSPCIRSANSASTCFSIHSLNPSCVHSASLKTLTFEPARPAFSM